MKPKNFILAVLLVVIVAIGVWWFMRSATTVTEKTADASALSKVGASNGVASPQIAKPLSSTVQAKTETANTSVTAADATPDAADPQADLKTALPDIARLLRSGDWLVVDQTYTPPYKLTPEVMQEFLDAKQIEQASLVGLAPDLQQTILRGRQQIQEEAAQDIEDLESQTPTYNDAGDEATYLYTARVMGKPADHPERKTFIKINGKWYIKGSE